MPGEYHIGLSVYPCISYPDGSVGYCSKIISMKFGAAQEESVPFAWRQAGDDAIGIPIDELVAALKELGVTVTLDEQRLELLTAELTDE